VSDDDREYLVRADEGSNDNWAGTASADTNITIHGRDLYELAQLDRDRWLIVGLDFYGGGRPETENVYLYAVDRERDGIGSHKDMVDFVRQEGSFPVTSILLHDVKAQQIIDGVFKSYHVQLRHRGWHERQMHIVDRADIPEQD
jgi:hypothetical protein